MDEAFEAWWQRPTTPAEIGYAAVGTKKEYGLALAAFRAGRSYEKTAHGGCCHSEGTKECVSLERPETAAPTTEAGDTEG